MHYSITFNFGLHALEEEGSRNFFSDSFFFGNVFAWISILAGAFDGLENLALIQFLLGSELTFWNGMYRWSALAKSSGLVVYLGEVVDSQAGDETPAMP